MKKILLTILISLGIIAAVSAEAKILVQVDGPESSYNQLRIVNFTGCEKLDVSAVYLTEENGSVAVKDKIGDFILAKNGDTESLRTSLRKKQNIGIIIPEEIKDLSYAVDYINLPFFDVISVILYSGDSSVGEQVTKAGF